MKGTVNDIKNLAEIMLSLSEEQRKALLDKSRNMQFDNAKRVAPDIENKMRSLAQMLSSIPEEKQKEVCEFALDLKEKSSNAEIIFKIKA